MAKIKQSRRLFKLLENSGCRIENSKKGVKIFQAQTQSAMINGVLHTRRLARVPFYSMHLSDRSGLKPFLDFILNHWDITFVQSMARDLAVLGYPSFCKKVTKRNR